MMVVWFCATNRFNNRSMSANRFLVSAMSDIIRQRPIRCRQMSITVNTSCEQTCSTFVCLYDYTAQAALISAFDESIRADRIRFTMLFNRRFPTFSLAVSYAFRS